MQMSGHYVQVSHSFQIRTHSHSGSYFSSLAQSSLFRKLSTLSKYFQISRFSCGLCSERPGFYTRKDFSLLQKVQTGSEAYPASYPMGTGDVSPRVKQSGCESDHSPPSSVAIKNSAAESLLLK
jgi:hypothetical protein